MNYLQSPRYMLSLTAYFLVFLDPKADQSDLQNVLMFERGIEFFVYIIYHLFWRGKSEIKSLLSYDSTGSQAVVL